MEKRTRTRLGQYHLWGQGNRSSATADPVEGHRHAATVDAVLDQVHAHPKVCEHGRFGGDARVGDQDVVQPATSARQCVKKRRAIGMALELDALDVTVHDAVLLQMADSPEQIVDDLHCSQLSEGSTLLPCPLVNTLQVVGKERHDNEHRARVDDIGLEVPGR